MSRLQKELKQSFDLASLRHEAAQKLTGEEWKRYSEIKDRHDQTRRFVNRSYEMDKPELIAKAKRRLIDEAGSKTLDFKHRLFGADRFDKDQLHRRAVRRVEQAQSRDLGDVDRKESAELRALMERSKANQELQEKPKRDFNQAVDRRSGAERRRSITRS